MTDVILIAGGGIGGLAAAMALSKVGRRVRVFEARPDPAEAGAGLQISANGVKALRWLGVEAAALARASRPEALELRLPGSGRVVTRGPLGAAHEARYGAPYLHMHRAALHGVLLEAARAEPRIEIALGRAVVGAANTADGVTAELEGGEEVIGAALIGADGIRSSVRADVAGQDEPRFTGMVAWRMTVPADTAARAAPRVATVWMGRGKHLVVYPLADPAVVNLVGVVERRDWRGESWTEAGDPAELRGEFGGWSPEIDALLAQVESPWRWALHERAPLSVWNAGRIALLGDACHAMPPFLAQGACMALEDAVILARRIEAHGDDLTSALRDYTLARRDRTERVQRESWRNAWRFHLDHPALRFCVYGALGIASRIAPARPMRMFDWLYAYDPAAD